MRKMIVMLLAAPALVLALLAPGTSAAAAPVPAGTPAAATAERQAVGQAERKHKKKVTKKKRAGKKAHRRGLSVRDMRVWNRLARCEASGRWWINTGNGYYGGLQIHPGTWAGYGGKKFAANAHRASKFEQVKIGQKIRRGQGWGAWPSCSSRLGLR